MSNGSDSTRSRTAFTGRSRVRRTGMMLGAAAVLGLAAAGISYASIPDGTGVIHGCYTTASPHKVQVIDTAKTAKCPSGTTSLNWNQTGPQGPAGVSTGISVSSSTSLPLNTGVNNFTPVLTTAPAPVAGTYYINATIMTYEAQGDGVDCILSDSTGVPGAIYADNDPVAASGFQTLPLGQAVPLNAGETVSVFCGDYTANASTTFYDGAVTGTLIDSATGNAANRSATARHLQSPRPSAG